MLIIILIIGLIDQFLYSFQLNLILNMIGWGVTLTPFIITILLWHSTPAEFKINQLEAANIFAKPPKPL